MALGRCITTLAQQLKQHVPGLLAAVGQGVAVGYVGENGQVLGLASGRPGQLEQVVGQPGLPGTAPPGSVAGSTNPVISPVAGAVPPVGPISDEALPLLEASYGLYTEHFVLPGPEHGAGHWDAALQTVAPVRPSLLLHLHQHTQALCPAAFDSWRATLHVCNHYVGQ